LILQLAQRNNGIGNCCLAFGKFQRRTEIFLCQPLGYLEPFTRHIQIGHRGGNLLGKRARIQPHYNIAGLDRRALDRMYLDDLTISLRGYGHFKFCLAHPTGANCARNRLIFDNDGRHAKEPVLLSRSGDCFILCALLLVCWYCRL
jgi:hypothetical protein